MNCNELHKTHIFFLDGDLSPAKMEEVQNHLEECSSCAAFSEELKRTLGIIDIEKEFEVNPYFYTRLKAKLENRAAKVAPTFGRTILRRVLQPAIFSLLLVIGIYSGIKIGKPASTEQYTITLMQNQEIPYLNEMVTETIESSLMD